MARQAPSSKDGSEVSPETVLLRDRILRRVFELSREELLELQSFLDGILSAAKRPVPNSKVQTSQVVPHLTAAVSSVSNELRHWPHAPPHKLSECGTYMVTASTLNKQHLFRGSERLDFLTGKLLESSLEFGWQLEAWAVFSNHYHIVCHGTPGCGRLADMLSKLHGTTANEINSRDVEPGRQVWFNFWDTELTIESSYMARLNYVHQNAVRHGLVEVARNYRWCSAAWFEKAARPAQVKTIYAFKIDKVRVHDDYDPIV